MSLAETPIGDPQPLRRTAATAVLRPRRSPRLVVAGALAACLGALGAAVAYTQASSQSAVVVMVNDVARGEQVQADDLGIATVNTAPGVESLPADDLQRLIGKQALVDLPKGSLVGSRSVGEPLAPTGASEIGLKLTAGRMPTTVLPPGTKVLVVPLAAKDESATSGANPGSSVPAVVVQAARELPDGVSWTLGVAVDSGHAERLAQLAALDQVVVVKVGGS